MSKVICDVCGTTYPETAASCPICGCAKNTTAQTAADSSQQGEDSGYTYVKGGRFSKKNVRKRNKAGGKNYDRSKDASGGQDGANKGLVAVIVILVLAIVAVLIYIGIRAFTPAENPNSGSSGQTTEAPQPSTSTAPSVNTDVPCTDIKLSNENITFDIEGSAWLLSVEAEPANTTDTVTFQSSDERVATVTDNGNIKAIGGGEATITVTCGDIVKTCKVVCTFGEPVQPTDETTEPTVEVPDGFVLKLNSEDFTLSSEGSSWQLYKETNGVKASDITWTVDDPKVATVEDGKVTAVDYGDTKVHATYGDQTATCIVRVRFHAAEENDGEAEGEKLTINKTDVTIDVGETFLLTLTNSEGVKIDVQWTANKEGYLEIDGSRITAIASGESTTTKIEVSTTYEGRTYSCVIYVKKAET